MKYTTSKNIPNQSHIDSKEVHHIYGKKSPMCIERSDRQDRTRTGQWTGQVRTGKDRTGQMFPRTVPQVVFALFSKKYAFVS